MSSLAGLALTLLDNLERSIVPFVSLMDRLLPSRYCPVRLLPHIRPAYTLLVEEEDDEGFKKVVIETGLLQRCNSPYITRLLGAHLKEHRDLWVCVRFRWHFHSISIACHGVLRCGLCCWHHGQDWLPDGRGSDCRHLLAHPTGPYIPSRKSHDSPVRHLELAVGLVLILFCQ